MTTTPEETQDLPPAPVAEEPDAWRPINTPEVIVAFIRACIAFEERQVNGLPPIRQLEFTARYFRKILYSTIDRLESLDGQSAVPDVDALAQHIRKIDGNNDMGAGALAESICNWIEEQKQ